MARVPYKAVSFHIGLIDVHRAHEFFINKVVSVAAGQDEIEISRNLSLSLHTF